MSVLLGIVIIIIIIIIIIILLRQPALRSSCFTLDSTNSVTASLQQLTQGGNTQKPVLVQIDDRRQKIERVNFWQRCPFCVATSEKGTTILTR